MIITKIFETGITIDDPFIMYSNNVDNEIMNLLRKYFVNVCYKSCYVLEIIRIIKRSRLEAHIDTSGDMFVCVVFEAKVIVYQPNEIIADATIVNKDSSGGVQCTTDKCAIDVAPSKALNMFNNDDKIPVSCTKLRYMYRMNKISTIASLFRPVVNRDPVVFKCSTEGTAIDPTTLIKDYSDLVRQIESGKDERTEFFVKLLYPYPKGQTPDYVLQLKASGILNKEDNVELVDFLSPETYKPGYYVLPDTLNLSTHTCYYIPFGTGMDTNLPNYVDETIQSVMETFVGEYLIYLSSIESLLNRYKSFDDMKKHQVLLKIFNKQKQVEQASK